MQLSLHCLCACMKEQGKNKQQDSVCCQGEWGEGKESFFLLLPFTCTPFILLHWLIFNFLWIIIIFIPFFTVFYLLNDHLQHRLMMVKAQHLLVIWLRWLPDVKDALWLVEGPGLGAWPPIMHYVTKWESYTLSLLHIVEVWNVQKHKIVFLLMALNTVYFFCNFNRS